MIWQTTTIKSQSSEAKEAEAAHAVRFAGEIQSRQTREIQERERGGNLGSSAGLPRRGNTGEAFLLSENTRQYE